MSEYQYDEFVAVDRPLDEGWVRSLASRRVAAGSGGHASPAATPPPGVGRCRVIVQ
jgi:hypothetical protein